MDKDEISLLQSASQSFCILLICLFISLEQGLGNFAAAPLQSIVHILCALIELPLSINNFPAGFKAQLLLQRDHTMKNLGYPTTLLGRIYMHYPCTSERLG
jgi:hypothetical protein